MRRGGVEPPDPDARRALAASIELVGSRFASPSVQWDEGRGRLDRRKGLIRRIVAPPDDRALIGRAQRGEGSAFEELVRRYDGRVLRLALRIVRSEDEARDIYQEAFLRIHRALGAFRHDSTLDTWIVRIVTNVCIDRLRRRAGRDTVVASGVEGGGDREPPGERVADQRPGADPERVLAGRETRERIDRALARLSPRERMVFELRHYEGLRLAAIAEILESTEEAARQSLFRAHREMRGMLRDLRGPAAREGGPTIEPGGRRRADALEAGS